MTEPLASALCAGARLRLTSSLLLLLLPCAWLSLFLLLLPSSLPSVSGSLTDASAPERRSWSTSTELSSLDVLSDFHLLTQDGDLSSTAPLSHFHPQSVHRFRTLDASDPTAAPTYTHLPSPDGRMTANGLFYQPFPSSLTLTFTAFSQTFRLPLTLSPPLFDPSANTSKPIITHMSEATNEVLESFTAPLSSYHWRQGGDWASVTLREDGRFHLVLQQEGEVYQADPVEHFRHDMELSQWRLMARDSDRGMMIFKHSHLMGQHNKQCGGDVLERNQQSMLEGDDLSNLFRSSPAGGRAPSAPSSSPSSSSSSRRLLQTAYGDVFPTATTEAGIKKFSCVSSPQRLSIAGIVDAGWAQLFGSNIPDIIAAVTAVYSTVNALYLPQLNLYITVTSLQIWTQPNPPNGPNVWNIAPPQGAAWYYCTDPNLYPQCHDINTQLTELDQWRMANQPYNGGAFILFTNCWPAPGLVGLSYYDWICGNQYAESVASYNNPYWLTVAHEIGHTLGAYHTFGLGGVMDYNVGGHYPLPNGPYQFHPDNEQQICYIMNDEIGNYFNVEPYCIVPYTPTCGNGLVEGSEQCDDTSVCCTPQCTLAPSAQCSGNGTCCSSTCQFVPSTTLCAAGGGFCSNGACLLSSCPTGYPLCAMDQGGCRQLCTASGQCIPFSGQGYLLHDNTTCSVSPYSVCQTGQCVSAVVSFAWTTSAWSSCSCTSTQTRTVQCSGSDGLTYPSSRCPAAVPIPTQSCTAPLSCFTFSFVYSAWSTCCNTCDGGTMSRTATCQVSTNPITTLPTANCTAAGIPLAALSSACNTSPCVYSWVSPAWSSCSVTCGGGTQTRTSTCWRVINGGSQQQPNAACTAALGMTPIDAQQCNAQACDVYGWVYGSYGNCNVTAGCGGGGWGMQTRSAVCMDLTTNKQAASSSSCTTAAVFTQPCGNSLCPSYVWIYSNWTSCSVGCGGGVQTRTAQCYDSVYAQWPATSTCTLALPSPVTAQACNVQACPAPAIVYTWSASPYWSACPVVCGGGVQVRAVSCINPLTSAVVSSTLCPTSSIPSATQACATRTCDIYSWVAGAWSTCSSNCTGGVQYRQVQCRNFYTAVLIPWSQCLPYMTTALPSTVQNCNSNVPCSKEQGGDVVSPWPGFNVSEWSECSVSCGGGLQERSVECVEPSVCSWGNAPSPVQSCNSQQCPPSWSLSSWSSCSLQCGAGSMQRGAQCLQWLSNGTVLSVNSSQCTQTQPSINGECNVFPCPSWAYSSWSACSAQCGLGVQNRSVVCLNYDGTFAANTACASQPQLPLQQTCGEDTPCPHWHRSLWTPCSEQCGGGFQTRNLTCRMPHDAVYEGMLVDPSLCLTPSAGAAATGDGPGVNDEAPGFPITSQTCNSQPCALYYWDVAPTSPCSAACGGTQQLSVGCYTGSASARVSVSSDLCAAAAEPASTQACSTSECTTSAAWAVLSDWSNCSALCGSGTQSREVSCNSALNGSAVDESECDLSSMPAVTQPCTLPPSTCYGPPYTDEYNGLCSLSTSTCTCRQGWTGPTCSIAPSFTDVQTGAAAFPHGVALGEVLIIQWQWTGEMDFVSILLVRDNTTEWPVGQYIARHVVNTGGYQWVVGSQLTDLDAGDDYRVQLWFSSEVSGESDAFAIADPCGYVQCSAYGVCVAGECECINGYSGSDCSISPCAALQCNPAHSACVDESGGGQVVVTNSTLLPVEDVACVCQGGWSGPQCQTPPSCNTTCSGNGDTRPSSIISSGNSSSLAVYECGQCLCEGNWGGPQCSQCPLQCSNGGVVDANCTSCQCPANSGWFGPSCGCRYYLVTLALDVLNATAIVADPLTLARFQRSLATDLSIAAGYSSLQRVTVSIQSTTLQQSGDGLTVNARFAKDCALSSQATTLTSSTPDSPIVRGVGSVAYSSAAQSLAVLRARAAQSGAGSAASALNLGGTWAAFAAQFGDSDSVVYKGVVTAYIDLTVPVTVVDPTRIDQPANPPAPANAFLIASNSAASSTAPAGGGGHSSTSASSSLPLPIYALCAVVAGPLVVIFFSLLLYRRYRKAQASPSSSSRSSISYNPQSSPSLTSSSSSHPLPAAVVKAPIHVSLNRYRASLPSIEISPPASQAGLSHPLPSPTMSPPSSSYSGSSFSGLQPPSPCPSSPSPSTGTGLSPLLTAAASLERSISDSSVGYVEYKERDMGSRGRVGARRGGRAEGGGRAALRVEDMPELELADTRGVAFTAPQAQHLHPTIGAATAASPTPPPLPAGRGGRGRGPPPVPAQFRKQPPPVPPQFRK